MANRENRADELAAWVHETVGVPVEVVRLPGGGSHEAWSARSADGGRWFIRADSGPPPHGKHYTLRREAAFYRAARAAGVPCPRVLAVHPDLEMVLLEHAEGDAAFARLEPAAQSRIMDDFAPLLARLHAADPADLDLDVDPAWTIADHTRRELDIWQSRLDGADQAHPFLSACFMWLRDHNHEVGGRPSMVQGDTGPGNFLHDGNRVTAFLDFELAHLGDPMTDLAWVGTRNAQEPVPDFAHFLDTYADAAGVEPDPDRLRFHALFAELRIAVMGATRAGSTDADLGAQIIFGALHYRLTVEAMAAAAGCDMPETRLPPAADTDQTRYFDGSLHQLREIVAPAIQDPFAARRLKNMARVFKYLREVDRVGGAHEDDELADMAVLLGATPDTIEEGRRELDRLVRRGELDAVALLPYAAARSARTHQLAGSAMGALANRHLPDFG